ncbi:MAG: hypothetical protein EOP83_15515 [Verrucomicrobiaceae bacterium]|nr:MAG: hypothetical protein EOP83_15515 [Verrucomicrobiaceae bacterium]
MGIAQQSSARIDWLERWKAIPWVTPEVKLYRTFGAYHFSAMGDSRDDEFERFLQWCDDRGIELHHNHDFEKPKRRYGSGSGLTPDLAMEMRMTWGFLTFTDRGGW